MAAIKKQSLVDQIYQRLRENIITMQLPLGSHLNVNELQSQMGVSCTPIREAINRLQQEGLVVYENNVGARVLMLDEHDVREIQELAATLQVTAVRLALRQGDRQRMALEIREQIRRYEQALTPQEEGGAVHELVGVFYHNCGNNVVLMADAIFGLGAMGYHFGNAIRLADMLPHAPADRLVLGNVDPAGQLRNGTPESIRAATLQVMEDCSRWPNFVPSTGCDVPPMSSWENIDAFFSAVAEFQGRS